MAKTPASEPVNAPSPVPVLQVSNLRTQFKNVRTNQIVNAVNGVSFDLRRGEILGVVGESGSGKSAMAMSLLRLMPRNGRVVSGEVILDGRDLMKLSEDEMRDVRGKEIGFAPQDPLVSLNPLLTAGSQISEGLRHHVGLGKATAKERSLELLRHVKISDPELRYSSYPHQLSGGMRQRVASAIGVSCAPLVLIADEPTTALDVTIQAQVLLLLRQLRNDSNMAIILITHDLGVVAQLCDNVAVFYGGSIVETGSVDGVFRNPAHPYTAGLLRSIPSFAFDKTMSNRRLFSIPGAPPDPTKWDSGCRFMPRCTRSDSRCAVLPEITAGQDGKGAYRCWNPVTGADLT